ncbi:nitrate ABC transporter substrate-binding protein [Tatumella morbirosei]|uniref:Nitrate ABC transporter substrate-binding protein n=1 Tax=Tatumella morbirosei TaxID=642227 RepID=A0A095T5R0_9GAMM|nr:ABC transporter substrate-binding protein [Tatumella morbirosei]KGD72022.1 nitrate ABC transporter substrate-binding protein [Tatumella morbirosei]
MNARMPIFKYRLLSAITGIALLGAASQASAVENIKIGTVVWVGQAPFYLAEKLDFFKKYNLHATLQFFSDPALIPSAMLSGAVNAGTLTYDQVLTYNAKKIPQRVVMPIDFSYGGDAIVADKDIHSVADFKGKSVGYSPNSTSEFLLTYALQSNNMSYKDINPISIDGQAVPGAMVSGSLPVGVTYAPYITKLTDMKSGKFHVVYSSKQAPGLIADVLVVDQDQIDKHPEAVEGMMRAYLDGMKYLQAHPDESAKIIAPILGVPVSDVKQQLSLVYNVSLKDMHQSFEQNSSTKSLWGSGKIIGDILIKNKQITAIPDIRQTYNDSFVKKIENSPGE